jgi:ankyrin repeat protein
MASLLAQHSERKIRVEKIDEARRKLSVFDAADEGKLEELQRILDESPSNIYKTHDYGYASALHYACKSGHYDCAKLLLDRGANVNAKTQSAETSLHYAAQYGHPEIARLLLERGADPTITNFYRDGNAICRDTPRQVAVYYQQAAVVAVLDEFAEKAKNAQPQQSQ